MCFQKHCAVCATLNQRERMKELKIPVIDSIPISQPAVRDEQRLLFLQPFFAISEIWLAFCPPVLITNTKKHRLSQINSTSCVYFQMFHSQTRDYIQFQFLRNKRTLKFLGIEIFIFFVLCLK